LVHFMTRQTRRRLQARDVPGPAYPGPTMTISKFLLLRIAPLLLAGAFGAATSIVTVLATNRVTKNGWKAGVYERFAAETWPTGSHVRDVEALLRVKGRCVALALFSDGEVKRLAFDLEKILSELAKHTNPTRPGQLVSTDEVARIYEKADRVFWQLWGAMKRELGCD